MDATFDGTAVRGEGAAREQFYDARGYGRPDDGGVVLAPVEAAHLLFRGDLDTVVDRRPTGNGRQLDFPAFLDSTAVSEVDFFVYKDLRDRGFYLSPADRTGAASTGKFAVYPRGKGPWDDAVAYRVRAVSERATVDARALRGLADTAGDMASDRGSDDPEPGSGTGDVPSGFGAGTAGVLAVVDEESEITYLELDAPTLSGSTHHDIPPVEGDLLADRVLVWDAPDPLYGRAFYGQPLDDGVQLSLVEAASLAGTGTLTVDGGETAVVERGRAVEGDRFDRRLRAYGALRTAGIVPKTGFKFGADFRTYDDVADVEDLGHSERLVRVLPPEHGLAPRDLALDVRLAHGVRKRMVYALTGTDGGLTWLSVDRLTP